MTNVIKYYIEEYIKTHPDALDKYNRLKSFKNIIDIIYGKESNEEVIRFILSYILTAESINQTVFCDMCTMHQDAFIDVASANYLNNSIYNMETTNSIVISAIMEEVYKQNHNGQPPPKDET